MTRNQYYHAIYIYKQRREVAKRLFKETRGEQYRKIFTHLTRKIKAWNRQIKRLDERKSKISKILKLVNRYFNVKVDSRELNKKHKLARNIYYKIGIESNLRGQWVAKFINRNGRMAELGRMSLTQSFKTNPSNREAFYNFKKYYETEKTQVSEQAKINSLHIGSTNFSILTPKGYRIPFYDLSTEFNRINIATNSMSKSQ